MATLSSELKSKVVQYLQGQVSLEELEDWLVPQMQRFMEPPATPDAELAAAVYHGLIEIGDGLRTEDQMREYVQGVLRRLEAEPCPADCRQEVRSSAINRMTRVQCDYLSVSESTVTYEVRRL